jgi:carboxypeptidase Q
MVRSSILLACSVAALGSASHTPPNAPLAPRADPPPKPYTQGPKVDSKKLQDSIKTAALEKKARELENAAFSTPQRNRVFSSAGHENTLAFIESYLETVKDSYTYERQEFQALYSQAGGSFSSAGTEYDITVYQYSPSGEATANIVAVDNLGCTAEDYPAEVEGNIALISRGECAFGIKSGLAGGAGAVAAIIYNNIDGPVSGGTLGPPPGAAGDYVPSLGVSQADGLALLEAVGAGAVEGVIQVESIIENRTT